MKIKMQELRELLNVKEKDLKKLSVEQLRLLLGVVHFLARLIQREINSRMDELSINKKSG